MMNRRIIWRIVLGLLLLLAVALSVVYVFIPLFDTSDEDILYIHPTTHRYADEYEGALVLENETLRFELDPDTTVFTVTDSRTGKVWSSVAEGMDMEKDPKQLAVEDKRLRSMLLLEYMNSAGRKVSMNAYEYSIANRLYTVDELDENGDGSADAIRINFTVGNIQRTYYYPEAILDADMQALLSGLSSRDQRNITDRYQAKGIDPVTGDNNYKKDDDIAALEAAYPALKDGVVWVLRAKLTNNPLNANNSEKLEGYLAAAGYTVEDYERDLLLTTADENAEGATDAPIFNISVIFRLEGDDLMVEIPLEDVAYNPDYPVVSLDVLPAFGSVSNEKAEGAYKHTGYFLVPEGSGAIIRFNNEKYKQSAYKANLYGHDYATIRKEVNGETHALFSAYGLAVDGSAFLCIIEEGQSWAGVTANTAGQPSYGNYNSANVFYTLIHGDNYDVSERSNNKVYMFEQELAEGSLVQRYRFIASDDYMAMAEVYREYLLAENPELNRTLSSEATPVIDLVGAIDKVQQVLGVPTNVPIPLTTYAQAQELLERLVAEQLPNLTIRYSGWTNGGLNQSLLNDVRLMSEMGKTSELTALIKAAADSGVDLYLDGLTCFARDSGLTEGFLATRDAARHTTREVAEIPEYSSIWYGPQEWRDNYYLIKPALMTQAMDVLSDAVTEYGAAGVSYRDVGSILSGDHDPKEFVTREEVRAMQEEKLISQSAKGQKIMTRTGNDYAAVLSDIIIDLDLDGTNYNVIDAFVPFYPAALHGSVVYTGAAINLADDREELLLRSAEMGASLQYALMASNVQELQDSWFSEYYGADASMIYDDMVQELRNYNQKLSGTFDQVMTGHQIEGQLTITEYENGVKVYVNFGYSDAEASDGTLVPARSFRVPANETDTAKEAIE